MIKREPSASSADAPFPAPSSRPRSRWKVPEIDLTKRPVIPQRLPAPAPIREKFRQTPQTFLSQTQKPQNNTPQETNFRFSPTNHQNEIEGLGQRVGCNPPSVLGDIHLIGIPAPQAALTGAYYPFHDVGWLFTLTASLLNASASSSATDGGFFLRLHPASQPTPLGATLPPRGWSFLRPSRGARSRPPTRQPNHHPTNAQ